MSDAIITVDNVSKRYQLGHQAAQKGRYLSLREVVGREARNFVRKSIDAVHGRQIVQGDDIEEFWALKHVSFEVKQGEVIGVIGRNGAGKSTLLKILSRITEPTEGKVILRGRLASLLEVGTGFHLELTGRENIFLNGAILGMSRQEIRQKLDEIVAFAEIERFLDTPVKRYSSGMYVRLAFAVAAHLEPEILLVDEVLAVGDAEFQKKCLGKIESASRCEGRTVLFVSHNLSAVADLANRGVLLDSGNVIANGSIDEVISAYLSRGAGRAVYVAGRDVKSSRPHVTRLEVLTSEGNSIHEYGKRLQIKIWISHVQPMMKACLSVVIVNQFQHAAVHAQAFNPEYCFGRESGETLLMCTFPYLRLNVGHYHIRTHLTEPPGMEIYENLDGLCPFEIVRTSDTILWGWHPEHCVYHEDWNWVMEKLPTG